MVLASLFGVTTCLWVLVWFPLGSSGVGTGLVVRGWLGYGSGLSTNGVGLVSLCIVWLLSDCVSFSSKGVWVLVLFGLLILVCGGSPMNSSVGAYCLHYLLLGKLGVGLSILGIMFSEREDLFDPSFVTI